MMRPFCILLLASSLWGCSGRAAPAGDGGEVGVDEHLGAKVPLDAAFADEDGRPIALRALVDVHSDVRATGNALELTAAQAGRVRERLIQRGVAAERIEVHGRGAYSRLKYESGGHRVQRVPETEAKGRIHTSAATVAVMAEPEDVETPRTRRCWRA